METYHLLQEDEAAWKNFASKQTFRAYFWEYAFPIISISTFILLLTLVIILSLENFRVSSNADALQIYSPVEGIVEYEARSQEDSIHVRTRYMASRINGLPDIGTDTAWEDLYKGHMHTNISPSEASRLPHQTMNIPGRPNEYLIQLEVFHQLHCVDLIRKALYLPVVERYRADFTDYVLPDGTKNLKSKDADHIDHCLDWIRQALLCQADVTPVHWAVDPVLKRPLPQLPLVKMCRNTNIIRDWARDRDVGEVDFGFGYE